MTQATLSPTAQDTLDNPILYTQTLLKIRSKIGEVIPFQLNRIQRRLCRTKQAALDKGRPAKFLILKARREGITTFEQAMNFHKVSTQFNQQVVTLAHETESAEKIFRIANLFYEQLPEAIRPKRLAAHNKRNFNFPSFNSFYDIGTAGGKAFGRGDTLNRVHWSEVAWSCNSVDDQRTLLSGLTEACSHGEIVLETTPNGTGDLFHEKSVGARKGENDWTFIFFTWWDDPTYFIKLTMAESADLVSSYTKDEKALVTKHGLKPEQMAWRRAQIRELRHLFQQEYPEDPDTCFVLSGSCFFDKQQLEIILVACPNPIEIKDNAEYLIWEHPQPGAVYVAASDLAEGVKGGNRCVCGVLNARTGEQAAVYRGNHTPEDFARISVKLATHYNNALLAFERNNHGHSALNTAHNQLEYKNLYWHRDYAGGSPSLGWPTTPKTRPIMLDDLKEAVEKLYMVVKDRQFIVECRVFGPNDRGKYEAQDDAIGDDSVIAWAIAWQMYQQNVRTSSPAVVTDTVRSYPDQQAQGKLFGSVPAATFGKGDGRMFT